MRRQTSAAAVLALFAAPALVFAQLVSGTITGTVSDNSGAILPGATVTLASDRLMGGTQTTVTNDRGEYRFENLPPGAYDVRVELTGFKSVANTGIRIAAGFVATINATLQVGQLEETISVSGESPVVDTKSNVQQTVMNQELLEGVPTGRDVWSVGKLIPGVAVATYDVGGTQGMQQSGMSAHGSRSDDKTFAIDGLAVNWPGAGGGSTMVYYDQGMFEEVNYQTSAIPAEVAIGGIYMNMVTKAGGNQWRADARYYWADKDTQASNFQDVSERFGFPGGNPITSQYDFNTTAAGPVLKDRIWLFTSIRRWKVDKELLSVKNSNGTNAIDDNLIWNASGKLTTALDANQKISVVYNYNQKNRYHRRDTPPDFVDDSASYLQLQPGYTAQVKYTTILRGSSVFESTFGGVKGVWPLHYQPNVGPDDIRVEDDIRSTAANAAQRWYENPNYRLQFDNIVSHTRSGWGGSHTFKGGVQFTRQFFQEVNRVNGDLHLISSDGVPSRVRAYNSPVDAKSYIHQLGFFGQDSWTIGRTLTINAGLRVDRATGWIPEQVSPAGRWVPERRLEKTTVYKQWMPVWRTGVVYDVFANGRTAIKGNYSRYGHQVGIDIVTNVHPFSLSSANIAWTDRNQNGRADDGELGAFEGFTGGASTRYTNPNGPDWGYSDEITAGVEHQVLRDIRVGVMYYHRTNRKLIGTRNLAAPPEAYTAATVPGPLGQPITFYNLRPEFVGKQQNVRDNIDLLDQDYDGVEVTAAKRLSDRWQMLLGFTAGRNEGGIALGDFNDPTNLINQQGVVGTDATYSLKLSGTYIIPVVDVNVSGSVIRNTGYALHPQFQVNRGLFPGLTVSSKNVRVKPRGEDRLPSVAMIDLRFSRAFRFGQTSIEPQMDIFNLTNADTIVGQVDTFGSRYGVPTEILAPRLLRVGVVMKF